MVTVADEARAAIVDLDGVVRRWDPAIMANAETAAGLPAGVLAQTAFSPELLTRAITGAITDIAWRAEIGEILQTRFGSGAELAVSQWSRHHGAVDTDVLQILRELRQAMPVALLSNATSRLGSDLDALGLTNEFDHIMNSSVLGVAKPDPMVFELACKTIDVPPSACLFIDDSPGNVSAASTHGLRAHHFTSVPACRAWLSS